THRLTADVEPSIIGIALIQHRSPEALGAQIVDRRSSSVRQNAGTIYSWLQELLGSRVSLFTDQYRRLATLSLVDYWYAQSSAAHR
ncbi:hypothetical protein HAX54_048531, partial [Datura stramonium]|nr:hypothetical protein [Datura stramonium]